MPDTESAEATLRKAGIRERRSKRRFTIQQEVRYKLLYGNRMTETGTGRTLNISSSGVWFTTEHILSAGLPVQLSMAWPALLNEVCPMKLMIYGCVVRSTEGGAAITIERYEFRTQGSAALQALRPVPNEARLLS